MQCRACSLPRSPLPLFCPNSSAMLSSFGLLSLSWPVSASPLGTLLPGLRKWGQARRGGYETQARRRSGRGRIRGQRDEPPRQRLSGRLERKDPLCCRLYRPSCVFCHICLPFFSCSFSSLDYHSSLGSRPSIFLLRGNSTSSKCPNAHGTSFCRSIFVTFRFSPLPQRFVVSSSSFHFPFLFL